MKRHVWFAVPAYSGTIHLGTMRSILHEIFILKSRGIDVTIEDECGSAMIADARGLLVAKFRADYDATDLLFIDHDVIWEAGKIADLIEKPVDFRVAIYPQRKDPINFCFTPNGAKASMELDAATGLLDIWRAPAGCMAISKRVAEVMTAQYQPLNFYSKDAPNQTVCGLFESYWMRHVPIPGGGFGNLKLGEDYSFCQRWIDLGEKIWVDPEITMGHVGNKTFVGKFGDWLREKAESGDWSA